MAITPCRLHAAAITPATKGIPRAALEAPLVLGIRCKGNRLDGRRGGSPATCLTVFCQRLASHNLGDD